MDSFSCIFFAAFPAGTEGNHHADSQQQAGKSQLVHLLCKERNGFKAGLALGGAARKGGVVAQTVIIHQIAEGEAVAEQDSLARCAVHGGLIRAIQRGKLFNIP